MALKRLNYQLIAHSFPELFANLALDEALLIQADRNDGPSILRTWEQPDLGVVMGASCRIARAVNVPACRTDSVTIARRASGGGTVLIGPGALNITLIQPIDAAPAAVDVAQRMIMGRIADQLGTTGLPVTLEGSGDLALGGRKIAGSAQRRLRRYFLVHATILYDLAPALIARYLGTPPDRQPDYRAGRPHESFVTNLPIDRPTILNALQGLGVTSVPGVSIPQSLVDELVQSKYADNAWIERF